MTLQEAPLGPQQPTPEQIQKRTDFENFIKGLKVEIAKAQIRSRHRIGCSTGPFGTHGIYHGEHDSDND